MSEIFMVFVGWTSVRPIIGDQHFSRVAVTAKNQNEAKLIAAQLVASKKNCEMVTSTTITF